MVTLANLRSRVRQRSDMENNNFVEDSEINQYICDSYAELYDLIVSRFEDYYVDDPLEFSLTVGSSTFTLPANFYKLIGVDRAIGTSEYYNIRPFSFQDRNRRRIGDRFRGLYAEVRYRLLGDKLKLTPENEASGDYRLWYVPCYTPLTADSDVVDSFVTRNGWEEFIIIDAAIKCLQKEESDVTVLFAQKAAMVKRIEEMAQNRDAGETETISDVTRGGRDPFFYE
jgi:hypothetical protein